MTGARHFMRQRERERRAAVKQRIIEVEHIAPTEPGDPGSVCVRYASAPKRYLTKQRAMLEPDVWARCPWWHTRETRTFSADGHALAGFGGGPSDIPSCQVCGAVAPPWDEVCPGVKPGHNKESNNE